MKCFRNQSTPIRTKTLTLLLAFIFSPLTNAFCCESILLNEKIPDKKYLAGQILQDPPSPIRFEISEFSSIPSGVHGMAVDENGVLYFSDTYSVLDDDSKVYTLAPPYTGKPVATNISGQSVSGLMWHKDKLYVAFLNKNEVVLYDKDLEFLESRPVNSPWNFTTDGRTVYVVTYFGELGVITNHRVKMFVKNLATPFDIQFSGSSSLWVSEQGNSEQAARISEYGYDGMLIGTLNLELSKPAGLETDIYNNLYIADKGANKILMVNPEGVKTLITDKYESPGTIVALPNGDIVVNSDTNGGTLLKIRQVK